MSTILLDTFHVLLTAFDSVSSRGHLDFYHHHLDLMATAMACLLFDDDPLVFFILLPSMFGFQPMLFSFQGLGRMLERGLSTPL